MRQLKFNYFKITKILLVLLVLQIIEIDYSPIDKRDDFKNKSNKLRVFEIKNQFKLKSKNHLVIYLKQDEANTLSNRRDTKIYSKILDGSHNYSINILYKSECLIEDLKALKKSISNIGDENSINLINCRDLNNQDIINKCFLVRYPKLPIILLALPQKINIHSDEFNKDSKLEADISSEKTDIDYYMIYSIPSIYHIERIVNTAKSYLSSCTNSNFTNFSSSFSESLGAVKLDKRTIDSNVNELNDNSLVVLVYILVWIILRFSIIKLISYLK